MLDNAFTDNVERNYHITAPGWNCMTHCQQQLSFPIRAKHRSIKTIKFNLPIFQQFLPAAEK
jgi:hypothetical protein